MKNKYLQVQKLLQRMALTPKMKHSIQMLGMSVGELNDYIDSAVASNPCLEKKIDKDFMKKYGKGKQFEPGSAVSYEYKDAIKSPEEKDPRETLLSQVRMLNLDKEELEIAEYLIYEIDENGYIKPDAEDVAGDLTADVETVQEVLEIVQSLDPPGIGAHDIRECLQLQLKRLGKEDSLEYTIVTDFISDLAINDIPKIAKSLDIDKERVRRAVDNIKALNPRPGSTLLSKTAERVIPDLIATVKNKKVRLELNRETISHLRLYNPYEDKLDIIKDPEAKKFLKENMEAAKHLIDNIKRREETMCRVADYILNIQREAFANDDNDIKTLTISDIAKALDLHPSTISRTVSNKFVQINDKVVPLKSFLSHGMTKENGEITSKASIKNRIRELVKNEERAKPLSDKAIKERLEQEGIRIQRRTVAKYRESLHILPAHLRKKKSAVF